MPEAKGLDIFDDMNYLFDWLHRDLPAYVSEQMASIEVDLTKVRAQGDSAGGYLSILCALHQRPGRLNAVIATYPFLDFADPHYHPPPTSASTTAGPLLSMPLPPASTIPDRVAGLAPHAIISSAVPPQRLLLSLSCAQQGLLPRLLGDSKSFYPMQLLDDLPGLVSKTGVAAVPPTFIYHGREDRAVPATGTERFVGKMRGMPGGRQRILMHIETGGHGFDNEPTVTLQTPWLREGLDFITPACLGMER
ncbi:MAG: hypothetical protein M1818_006301 [Claussenomyces sp. TS43310]|nr:MAG: hypothetical protein M1818_006301 [Claussenomyces sp. TS43310]